jgi:hypothetical protein
LPFLRKHCHTRTAVLSKLWDEFGNSGHTRCEPFRIASTLKRKVARSEAEQIIVRQMFNWITWGMIVFGIGVLLLVINRSFDMGAWIKLISSCLILGGAGIGAAGVLDSIRKGTQLSARRETREVREPVETKTLPATSSFPDALPSITERTTPLVSSEDSRQKNKV